MDWLLPTKASSQCISLRGAAGNSHQSVWLGMRDPVDDEHRDASALRLEAKTQLLAQRGEQRRTVHIGAFVLDGRTGVCDRIERPIQFVVEPARELCLVDGRAANE